MVLDDLKDLFRAKELTFEQYQEAVAAAHIRAESTSPKVYRKHQSSHSPAHSRASSLEKEVPVKIEALVTEMQELGKEELIKQEAHVKVQSQVKRAKSVKSVMKAPVKIEIPVKMEVSLSTKEDVKSVKDSVSEVSSPTKVKKDGKQDGVQLPRPLPRIPVPESADYSKSTEMEGDRSNEKGKRSQSSTGSKQMSAGGGKENGLASDRIAAGGAAGGSTRKGDDAELNGMCEGQGLSSNSSLSANGMSDRVAAGGAAGGPSRKGDDAEQKGMCEGQGKSSDSNPSANGMSTIGPPRGAGEAEGHSGSCDAEALTPGVEVSATKGMTEHVAEEGHVLKHPKANASNLKVTLESSVQWFLWQQKPNHKIFADQPPSDLTPFGGSPVTASSWACCQNSGVYVEEYLGLKVETMFPWSAYLMNIVGCAFIEEAATCVGVRRTGAAFGDPRVEDPGVEGRDTREGASGVCELILTQGTVRATRGGRAAPLY